jgi:hypothetical protein
MSKVSVKFLGSGSLSSKVRGRVQRTRTYISAAVTALWRAKVQASELSQPAKRRYSDAIEPYKGQRAGAYISEKVAQLLERGWKGFDMKPGLLGGFRSRAIPLLTGKTQTIRTVSVTSPAGAWRHPGFKGAKLAHRVQRGIKRIVKEAMKGAES